MKTYITNALLIILFLFNIAVPRAQEGKIKLHSASITAGLVGSSSATSSGGVNLGVDVAANLNKNLFAIYLNAGAEFNLFDASEGYTELNLTYGRAVALNDWIKIEGHIGLGYFNHRFRNGFTNLVAVSESTVGVPVRIKILFYTIDKLAIGFNPNINLNSLANTYSANFILQYDF
jgi:hypothetical protein